jgi:hypothetical protein
VLESVYNSSQQSYSEFLSQFPAQGSAMHGTCLLMSTEIRWAILDFPYLTLNGGRHSKLTFISWVPDDLRRPSMRETIRIKSTGVFCSGVLRSQMKSFDCIYQANCIDDLQRTNILDKVFRFERDPIDNASIDALIP